MGAQSAARAMEAGGDHVQVVQCSSGVLVPELAAGDLAVGVLVEYRVGSVIHGCHENLNVDGSPQVGEVRDGNWGQVEVVLHPNSVGFVLPHPNGGAGETGNQIGCNEAHQYSFQDGVELADKDREDLRDEHDKDVDEFEVVLDQVALQEP